MTPDEFMKHYEAVTSSHDLDGTLGMIAEDAVYLFSDQSSHLGKAAIKKALAANFNSITNEIYQLNDLRWLVVSQEVSACAYKFSWSGEIEGLPRSGKGRGTSVIRRAERTWLVVLEHLSAGGLS